MKVKAALARVHGDPLQIEGLDLDEPRSDEILVRLVASGVSRADQDAVDGHLAMPLPFVPGSEGAGIVERVGQSVTDLEPGDAIIVTPAACGHCANCRTGKPRRCVDFGALNLAGCRPDGSTPFWADGSAVNGFFFGQSSFATHLLCRAKSAIKLPTEAPLEILAALGGEMLVGAGTILHGLKLRSGDTLVVTGADAVGLIATMVAKARGAALIIIADPDEARRNLATKLGATVAVHMDEDLAAVVKSMTGAGVRFALETTGKAASHRACLDSLALGGICALVHPLATSAVDFEDRIADGDTLIISADGHAPPKRLIAELVALHADGHLPIEDLVSFFPFERVNDALEALVQGRAVKPVIRFSLGSFGNLDRAKIEGAASETPDGDTGDSSVPADEPAQDDPMREREPVVS